jgi:hypothetical protein
VEQIRPDVLVRERVVELVDTQVERALRRLPHEVVGRGRIDDPHVVRLAQPLDDGREIVRRCPGLCPDETTRAHQMR